MEKEIKWGSIDPETGLEMGFGNSCTDSVIVSLSAKNHQLQAENEKLKAEKRRLRSGLGILIQNWISVQKISDEGYIEESDVILSNAKQALSGQEGS